MLPRSGQRSACRLASPSPLLPLAPRVEAKAGRRLSRPVTPRDPAARSRNEAVSQCGPTEVKKEKS
ncbi:hypothetical protein R69919_02234 [Paraburkholderia gardini]|uniref:Uncharacterized protein n=1 Tax=Paraburkholderia gardini TaxID=2823469 RepID=A0ABM8TYS5_9BURK|nr:hypothetical protein R54767_00655 [Paraburkholderia gardini]CAG4896773.1 hypothetical protein R69919_02234 [Paraburkholderia gardini]